MANDPEVIEELEAVELEPEEPDDSLEGWFFQMGFDQIPASDSKWRLKRLEPKVARDGRTPLEGILSTTDTMPSYEQIQNLHGGGYYEMQRLGRRGENKTGWLKRNSKRFRVPGEPKDSWTPNTPETKTAAPSVMALTEKLLDRVVDGVDLGRPQTQEPYNERLLQRTEEMAMREAQAQVRVAEANVTRAEERAQAAEERAAEDRERVKALEERIREFEHGQSKFDMFMMMSQANRESTGQIIEREGTRTAQMVEKMAEERRRADEQLQRLQDQIDDERKRLHDAYSSRILQMEESHKLRLSQMEESHKLQVQVIRNELSNAHGQSLTLLKAQLTAMQGELTVIKGQLEAERGKNEQLWERINTATKHPNSSPLEVLREIKQIEAEYREGRNPEPADENPIAQASTMLGGITEMLKALKGQPAAAPPAAPATPVLPSARPAPPPQLTPSASPQLTPSAPAQYSLSALKPALEQLAQAYSSGMDAETTWGMFQAAHPDQGLVVRVARKDPAQLLELLERRGYIPTTLKSAKGHAFLLNFFQQLRAGAEQAAIAAQSATR